MSFDEIFDLATGVLVIFFTTSKILQSHWVVPNGGSQNVLILPAACSSHYCQTLALKHDYLCNTVHNPNMSNTFPSIRTTLVRSPQR